MKYLSLFTGIGGFELGIQQAYETTRNINVPKNGRGEKAETRVLQTRKRPYAVSGKGAVHTEDGNHEHPDGSTRKGQPHCVGYSEIDQYAIKIYDKHFKHKNYGDIKKINEKKLPDFDLLCGGFPCQAFSIAGRRRGFEDTRGTLFFEIARIIKQKRPRLLLLENVKGLLSHDHGRTFRTIIIALDELGYDLQWQVLNSKNHGVPQNRERVYIVGNLRGTPRPQIFPFIGRNEKGNSRLRQIGIVGKDSEATRIYDSQGISRTIKNGGGMGAKTGLYAIRQKGRGKNRGGDHAVAPTLTGKSYQDNNHVVAKTVRSGGRGSPHGSKQNWDTYEISGHVRRLTPIECERLQGFPDNWTDGVSDTQRYKTLGNAVTVNVIRDIMQEICRSSSLKP